MKTLQFSKSSWHYWVASEFGRMYSPSCVTDFCKYMRHVLLGIIILSIWIAAGSFILYLVGNFLAWGVACLVHWQRIPPDVEAFLVILILAAAMVVVCIAGLIAACVISLDKIGDYRREREYKRQYGDGSGNYVPPPPSFMDSVWRTIKDKTCFRVELK